MLMGSNASWAKVCDKHYNMIPTIYKSEASACYMSHACTFKCMLTHTHMHMLTCTLTLGDTHMYMC